MRNWSRRATKRHSTVPVPAGYCWRDSRARGRDEGAESNDFTPSLCTKHPAPKSTLRHWGENLDLYKTGLTPVFWVLSPH